VRTGEVLEIIEMPPETAVPGLESNGEDRYFCGVSGLIKVMARPD
jgi:hypothetical protein